MVCLTHTRSAMHVTSEHKPNSTGVVRAIATSLHGLGVSIPLGARASAQVTAMCHRRTNQVRMCSGVCSPCVDRKACGSCWPGGSRTTTQRSKTGWHPDCYPPQVAVEVSTSLVAPPYQGATALVVHGRLGSSSRCGGDGRRAPCTRGRPWCRGCRSGAGFHHSASIRKRVITGAGGMGRTACHSSSTAQLPSPTQSSVRSGTSV